MHDADVTYLYKGLTTSFEHDLISGQTRSILFVHK